MIDILFFIPILNICANIILFCILRKTLKQYRKSFDVDIEFLKERKEQIGLINNRIDNLSQSYQYFHDDFKNQETIIKDMENKIEILEGHVFNVIKSTLYQSGGKNIK